ncbi:formin-like protein 16 [Nymphaea colorata]|uniref:formin-like protein 16 n=1 Tax=Nymphaea colorata TaxID=210225 RepID=UPI00129D82A4|nr:formin-like protein 16 [Nymphaea colorata]
MDAQLSRRSVSMRPQLMDTIVVLIWLSLISICSSQTANLSSGQGNPNGASASSNSPPSPKPAQPPPHRPRNSPPPPTANGWRAQKSDPPPPPQSPSPPPPAPHKFEESDGNPSAKSPLGKTPRSHNGGSGSAEGKKNPLGKKLGIWFLGIAGCLQVAAVAFLSFKRRQIPAILEKSGTQLGD